MEKFEPTDEEIAEYAVLIRYYDTQDWLKHEINAGRYRDPKPELNEMIPDLSLGETLDPSEARPCLDEKPGPPLELGPGQVHLSEMELRECVRVAQARYDYKCAHQEEMDRWLEERARKVAHVATQMAAVERSHHRPLVDDRATGEVEHHAARTHQSQSSGAHQALGRDTFMGCAAP